MYTLYIGSETYNDYTLIDSISINYGRQNIQQQPSPATFSCILAIPKDQIITLFNVTDEIALTVYDDYATTEVTLFAGSITDYTIGVDRWGNANGIINYSITAVGWLNKLNRVDVGSAGYPKDYEGNRIESILIDCSVSNYFTDVGLYEMAAVSNGSYDALELAQNAANSAMGILTDKPSRSVEITPSIGYYDYNSRTYMPEISLSINDIAANGLGISKSLNNVVNQASVTYGSDSTNISTVYDDTTSQSNYGVISGQRNTYLHNVTDANSVAQILLSARSNPEFQLNSITVNTAFIDDTLKSSLYGLMCGTNITIDSLPFQELQSFKGFVEGWTWQINKNGSTLTMYVSSQGQIYPYTLWNQLSATDTWNTIYTSTTRWSDVN